MRTPRTTADEVVRAAATLLATQGPSALSARRVATELGTSTMTVYTHFGSMTDLVRAVVAEGFHQLDLHLEDLPITNDPRADLVAVARAYRANGLENPQLYAVMFGGIADDTSPLTPEDRRVGENSLTKLLEATKRAVAAGLLPEESHQWEHARRLWAVGHGFVSLELAGLLGSPERAEASFLAVVDALLAHSR
ncbi:possible transcriptional regulatory protein (probably tetr-family protein) [Janibacter sp. HTCC2649]|uniref:TetR/AcrR family transcriptional regulator n=1 Tax=Janibacter sp. HTCC2649 TaxID=313589 RepID=UPI000066F657|nr:TetR/AcrR family transcriptional regulator [Janibacter sp. HTCC2649]EAP97001.1 possible transcriptional regulatory protein (probably tetr-family protein) [Janibacter sp. HTCC2649]